MFKIVLLTRGIYLATLEAAIRVNIEQERFYIRANKSAIKKIDRIQDQIEKLLERIQSKEDAAEARIADAQRKLTADLNELQNLKDGV